MNGGLRSPPVSGVTLSTSQAEPLVSQAVCQLSGEYVDGSGNDQPVDDQ
jgi:hypothetical protein